MSEDEANKEVYPGTIQTAEVMVFRNDGKEILLAKYLQGGKKGKVGIPGGKLRLGDSLTETAARELVEELDLGLTELEVRTRLKGFENNFFTTANFPMKDATIRNASTVAFVLDGGIAGNVEVTSREPDKLEPVWMNVDDVRALPAEQKFDNTDNAINSYLSSKEA